jgi:hypothetical protein
LSKEKLGVNRQGSMHGEGGHTGKGVYRGQEKGVVRNLDRFWQG